MPVLRYLDSVVTDSCLPDALEPADIKKIIAVADKAEPVLVKLIQKVLKLMREPLFSAVQTQIKFPAIEEEILKFWKEQNIFENHLN